MGLRLSDHPALTATFTHPDGRVLCLDVLGCEVWALCAADLGPVLLTMRGSVYASAIRELLTAELNEGAWRYSGIEPLRAGDHAAGVIVCERGSKITIRWRGGGRHNLGRPASPPRPWRPIRTALAAGTPTSG